MYEPELEHEFCDAMTINTPTQLRVYIKKGVNNDFFKNFLLTTTDWENS